MENTPVIVRSFNFTNEYDNEELHHFRCRLYQKNQDYDAAVYENDFEVWIAGKDVAKFLKYVDTNDAIHQFVKEKYRMKYKQFQSVCRNQILNINPNTIFINRHGVDGLSKNSSYARKIFLNNLMQSIFEIRKYNPNFDDDLQTI